jgi:hypothetical protein
MTARTYGYVRLSIGGTAPGGESWSTGVALAAQNHPSVGDLDTWLASIQSGISGWFNGGAHSIAGVVASDTFLSNLRAYEYEPGGATANLQGTYEYSPAINGAAAHVLPLSSAMCVTLRTDKAGRHYRGRMYLPANGATLSNHTYVGTDVDAVALAMKDLMELLKGSTLSGGSIIPIVAGDTTTPGLVTSISVDNRPDTQRRRAKSERATYRQTATIS